MKRFCKKVLCLNLVLLLVISPISITSSSSAASVFDRQKKSIYLVLDDSGSMGREGTNDANYSLQTLLAMTDKNDLVKLYFLNQITGFGLSGKLDMSKKSNKWLSDVRKKYPNASGGTPYDKVMIAQQELTDSVSKDDNTEYWLVVFTDGSFATSNNVDPEQNLQTFAKTPLANGSYPNILYITVGGIAISTGGITNLHALTDTNIIDVMNEAAKLISGRIDINNAKYSADKKEVTFSLPYPARNIIVLTQNNETKITGYKSSSKINLSENYTVTYPGGARLDKSTVCFLTEKNGSSIASGEITLTFDKSITPENTSILFEPAIGMTARYYNADGQEVDPGKLYIGEEFKVEFEICDSETKQPLDPAIFGGNITYSSEINGKKENNSATRTFKIEGKDLDINLFATLPDGYVLKESRQYEILEKRIVTFTLSNGGKFSSDIRDLDKAEGINANILINGNPLTEKEFESFKIDIAGTNPFVSDFDIEKNTQNCNYVIHPKKGLISPLTPRNKTYTVTLTDEVRGDKYTADLIVEITGPRNWLSIILFILGILLIIYLIIVFATKTYFPKKLRFLMYSGNPPTTKKATHPITYKLSNLYWNEFKQCFKGNFIFFAHLFKQLLPNTQSCVTLYGIGKGAKNGYYSEITIYASTPNAIQALDKCIIYDEATKKYKSKFTIYSSNFKASVGAADLIPMPKGKPRFSLPMDKVLVRKGAPTPKSKIYLQITKKKKSK